jgi:hypothetical protein
MAHLGLGMLVHYLSYVTALYLGLGVISSCLTAGAHTLLLQAC